MSDNPVPDGFEMPVADDRRELRPVPSAMRAPDEPPASGCWLKALVAFAALALVLGVLGGWAIWSFADLTRGVFDAASSISSQPQYQDVWWTGDGEYAVAQSVDGNNVPVVVVWSKATGKIRIVKGQRVVAVEPNAPRIWVVAEKTAHASNAESADGQPFAFVGYEDAPTRDLKTIDLTKNDLAPEAAPRAWAPLAGRDGIAAELTVDPKVGALPSGIVFRKASGAAIVASLPTDLPTFTPLGFSPSGRYFAMVPALQADVSDAPWDRGPALTILSAETGKIVATAGVATGTVVDGSLGNARASWDASRDIIYYDDVAPMAPDDPEANEIPLLRFIAADGAQGIAAEKFGWKMPPLVKNAAEAQLLGESTSGPLWEVDPLDGGPVVYAVTPQGPVPTRVALPGLGDSVAVSSTGQILVLTQDTPDGTTRLSLLGPDGTSKTLWDDGIKRAGD